MPKPNFQGVENSTLCFSYKCHYQQCTTIFTIYGNIHLSDIIAHRGNTAIPNNVKKLSARTNSRYNAGLFSDFSNGPESKVRYISSQERIRTGG